MSYVSEFLSLKCAGDILNIAAPLGAAAQKEITESMAIIKRLRPIVLKEPMRYTVLDLCAGNALTSLLAVYLLPVQNAVAYDKRPRKRNWEMAKRFKYYTENVYDLNPKYIEKHIIIISVHPCEVAWQIVYLYNESKASHLLMMPCCEGRASQKIPVIVREKLGRYYSWALDLAMGASGTFVVDKKCMSPKNAIVMASKDKKHEFPLAKSPRKCRDVQQHSNTDSWKANDK